MISCETETIFCETENKFNNTSFSTMSTDPNNMLPMTPIMLLDCLRSQVSMKKDVGDVHSIW